MKKITLLFLLFTLAFNMRGQQVKGTVTDVNNEPIPGVNVVVSGTDKGAVTDFNGHFSFANLQLPTVLEFSYLGYETKKVNVSKAGSLKVVLKENQEFLDDVVVTASRSKESIKEAPVSIERYNLKAIKRTTSPSFYDGLANIKGVDLNTSSLTFQSVNTRGFSAFANERFVQLVDDMDNSSPALNFPLGNLVGMNELDVQSVEILPGASSALYGANAFNGILNMRSKSPFKYKGLSAYVKYGQTVQEAAGTNAYNAAGVRYAWGGKKIAAKVNFSFMKGTDWLAVDYSDVDTDPFNADKRGSRESNPSYDGFNVYGDDFAVLLPLSASTGGAVEDIRVSRTGYEERYLTDNKARNMKADIAFHYRPSGKSKGLEFIWVSRFGTGKTTYQGANKYVMNNFVIHQHKLEVKNKHFFLRAYYTGEDAGDTYDSRFTAWNINRKWRSDKDWYNDYAQVYAAARLGLVPGTGGTIFPEDQAHAIARNFADYSTVDLTGTPKTPRYKPGTPEFEKAFNEVISDGNFRTGGKFIDNSSVKHIEGNYNFKDLIDFAEIQVGGSLRRYSLHSAGTVFTDYPGLSAINIDQGGVYVQITKKLLDNRLKISNSIRYDKQKDINGNVSPRASLVYSAGKHKEHNFRVSFQTGFRNPTTQELYIGLDLGGFALVGGAPDNLDRYHETVIATDPGSGTQFDADVSGTDAYHNSYTLSSFQKFLVAYKNGDPNAASYLEIAKIGLIVPEQISTYEFGYRGKVKKIGIDFSVYFNSYKNFTTGQRVLALSHEVGNVNDATAFNAIMSSAVKPFQVYTNSKESVKSYGMDIGLNYKVSDFRIGLVYDYAKLDIGENPDMRTGFNTPEHRIKFSLGNDKLYKNLGFNVNVRYQTEFMWEASFGDGIVPARTVLDAQLNYNIKKYKTQFKIGGTNLLGTEYLPAPGTGLIGSMYYIGLTYGN